MRVVIADDEPLAREKLRLMLTAEPGVSILAECRNGAEILDALNTHKPDLLMLDVQMPELDGFAVLNQVPPESLPIIIFTTAFDRHAVRAFEANALDYLLKPFDQERLHQAVNRARAELVKANDREATHRILNFLSQNANWQSPSGRRLVIRSGGRVIFLGLDEIDYVEAAANYVKINVGKQSYLLRKGIGEIAEKLDPALFVRIHRSAIVNVRRIKELQPVNSGEYIVVLKDGKELSCSRGYRAGLQELVETSL
jgi:two-component system, LytTR family, response regulator